MTLIKQLTALFILAATIHPMETVLCLRAIARFATRHIIQQASRRALRAVQPSEANVLRVKRRSKMQGRGCKGNFFEESEAFGIKLPF